MEGFVNDFAKLVWLNFKYAKKEDKISLLMLYAAVQHPQNMNNLLPNYSVTQEEFDKER